MNNETAEKLGSGILTFIGLLCLIPIYSFVVTIPTYFLYNWIAVGDFNLPHLNFIHVWGLTCLCTILFKSASVKGKAE